jgi:hypothetical protein
VQSYTHTGTTRAVLARSDSSALTDQVLAPDAADHIAAADTFFSQFVSEPLAAQTFSVGATVKYALQGLEANAGNNLFVQVWIGIVNNAGTSALATLLSKSLDATELGTTVASRTASHTLTGGYTATGGERLVVEFSLQGTPVATSQVQGHNGTIKWGSNGAGGDLLENDTQTATNLNPWIEFGTTVTFQSTGTLSATFDAMTATSTATAAVAGTLSATFDATTLSATGTVASSGINASLNITFGAMAATASGTVETHASLSATFGAMTVTSTGTVETHASATATFDVMTLSAAGTVSSGISASLNITFAAMTATAAGTVGTHASVSATLAPMSGAAAGTVAVTAHLSTTFGAMTLAAEGVVGTAPITGTLNATFNSMTATASGVVAVVGSVNGTFDALTCVALGTVQIQGAAVFTFMAMSLTASVSGGGGADPITSIGVASERLGVPSMGQQTLRTPRITNETVSEDG